MVRVIDFVLFTIEFSLDNRQVTLEFLVQSTKARVLQGNKFINVDKVVTQSHLVLFLCLVQVAIDHLQNSVFSVHLTVMVLLVNLHLLLQLFCLCHTHDLTPVGKDLHSVEVCHFLLFIHSILEVVTP